MVAVVAAFVVVAGGAGTAAYLLASNRGDDSPSDGSTASPAAGVPTAEEIYDTSPWAYDITFDNGNHIQGELELIETYEHPDCASGGVTPVLRQALSECTGRVEAAFHGTLTGTMVVSEQVLMFADDDVAASFMEQFGDVYATEALLFQDPENIQAVAAFTNSWADGVGKYVVYTVFFSRTEDVDLQQGANDVAARNRETLNYLTTLG